MQWYHWVLVVVGLALFVYIKVKAASSFLRAMKRRQEERERQLEEEL
ncbi:MAG: hypothetical protein ACOX2K_04755 [Bacillota bacterium]